MILYLETSSLVKLYSQEPPTAERGQLAGWESALVRQLCQPPTILLTSRISYAEARAALARRRRERAFSNPRGYRVALRDFDKDWRERVLKVSVTEAIVRHAGDLAETRQLKGHDAIHLAAALAQQNRTTSSLVLSTWDNSLRRAAQSEGLTLAH